MAIVRTPSSAAVLPLLAKQQKKAANEMTTAVNKAPIPAPIPTYIIVDVNELSSPDDEPVVVASEETEAVVLI